MRIVGVVMNDIYRMLKEVVVGEERLNCVLEFCIFLEIVFFFIEGVF